MSNRHALQKKTPTHACNSSTNNARQRKGQLRNCQKDNSELTNDNGAISVDHLSAHFGSLVTYSRL